MDLVNKNFDDLSVISITRNPPPPCPKNKNNQIFLEMDLVSWPKTKTVTSTKAYVEKTSLEHRQLFIDARRQLEFR